jgi:transcriptional regulator with XRE-family HTH domain
MEVDLYVSSRIRGRRTMLGLTQQQLAERIGVTYQQAHKYETGMNRISAGRLYQLAQALEVEVSYFFDGVNAGLAPNPLRHPRIGLDLARCFLAISNCQHQEALCSLARTLAGGEVGGGGPAAVYG